MPKRSTEDLPNVLAQYLEGYDEVRAMTGKIPKIEGFRKNLAEWSINTPVTTFDPKIINDYQEPRYTSAARTAAHKSIHGEKQISTFPKLVSIGADTIHFSRDRDGSFTPHHKASENTPLDLIYVDLVERLRPDSTGKVNLAWDISASLRNGKSLGVARSVLVRARELDEDVIRDAFDTAVQKGTIFSMNTIVPLFELLRENNAITGLEVVKGTVRDNLAADPNLSAAENSIGSDREAIALVLSAIIETSPFILQPLVSQPRMRQ